MDPAALSIFPFQKMADRMEKDPVLLAASLPEFFLGDNAAGAIAIVDDDKWVLKSLERLVKSAGFKVKTFLSAEDFLQWNDSTMVCVILDIGLPGMSGLDLQRHLAAESSRVPIIFVSAHDETEMRTQALAGGAIAFLSKPVNDTALLNAVSSAVK
jgi:FixJ family two-component response regulator